VEPTIYDLLVSMPDGIKTVQVKTTTCKTDGWAVQVGRRPYLVGRIARHQLQAAALPERRLLLGAGFAGSSAGGEAVSLSARDGHIWTACCASEWQANRNLDDRSFGLLGALGRIVIALAEDGQGQTSGRAR
jgi:hypothetical protein